MIDPEQARARFESHFGLPPCLGARAPGRVNIIGEHTDYNHGFVLPMAIERETVILAAPRTDRLLNAYAADLDRSASVSLDQLERHPREPWIDYVTGVAHELSSLGKSLHGMDLTILGDVPVGCGLSSSASLEMAALTLFETAGHFHLDGAEGPRLGQRVENEFLGLSSGIMDQFISRMGRASHALFLDCRDYAYEHVSVAFDDARFVIANTGVARGLTASKYNERVAECAEAVAGMRAALGRDATHLRDLTPADLAACEGRLPDVPFRRARHVITENGRTQAACDAMRRGDTPTLGELMNLSDESLRADYEVTCPELDAMTAIARAIPGCLGSRMTGAGFGGCTVSLVASDRIEAFTEQLMTEYTARTTLEGAVIISSPADGAAPCLLSD